MIHDVSTDTQDPPQFVTLREVRLKCRNGADYSGVRGAQHQPDIVPQVYKQPPAKIFQAAREAANALLWQIAAAVESDGRIEATATTRIMRFKDDVVIRIRKHNGGTRLDIRSASRVGRSDLGANVRRIRGFFDKLNNLLKTNT
jgi:uncharacterized protein (DUF1499 family)